MRAFIYLVVLIACFQASLGTTCNDLSALYRKQRFLTFAERSSYCSMKCDFANISCEDFEGGVFDFSGFVKKSYDFIKDYALGKKTVPELFPLFTFVGNKMILTQSLIFFAPYLSVILPMASRHVLGGNGGWTLLFNSIYLVFGCLFFFSGWFQMVHALIYAYIGAFIPVTSRFYQDTAVTYLAVIALALVSVSTPNPVVCLIIGIICSFVFLYFIKEAVTGKTEAQRVLVLLNGLMLGVVGKYIHFLASMFAIDSAGIAYVKLFVEAVLPYGTSSSTIGNAANSALTLAKAFEARDEWKVSVFIFGFLSYLIIFITIRAVIGSLVLSTLRFKTSPEALRVGLYSYMIDIVGPWTALLNLLGWFDSQITRRRCLYGLLTSTMSTFELCCGIEFFILRIVLLGTDTLIVRSGLNDISKFLEISIDCSGIAFPKAGSFPFFSLEALAALSKSVVEVVVQIRDNEGHVVEAKRGVGFLREDERGNKSLMTVRHVLELGHRILFGEEDHAIGVVNQIGGSNDPVSSMHVNSKLKASCIPCLSESEKSFVSHLFMLAPNSPCALIDKFSFDKEGDIHATVNVMTGDSGSPVVAVLNNGELRLAGAVSRGSYHYGSQNVVSSVLGKVPHGSPGHSNPYLEVGLPEDIALIPHLQKLQRLNADAYDDYFQDLDDWRRIRDADPDVMEEKDEEFRKKAKEKTKSWKKNRAYKKRLESFAPLVDMLRCDQAFKTELLQSFARGDIVDFNILRRNRYGFSAADQTGVGFR